MREALPCASEQPLNPEEKIDLWRGSFLLLWDGGANTFDEPLQSLEYWKRQQIYSKASEMVRCMTWDGSGMY